MKTVFGFGLAAGLALVGSTAAAQVVVPPQPARPATEDAQQEAVNPWYYGGSVTMSFSGATRIGVFPMVGYKVSPQASLGAKVGYEYVDYSNSNFSANNYGAGIFARYRFVPQAYAHGEFQYVNFERPAAGGSTRDWVPFLLLGGGVVQRVGGRTAAYVEVLFDVLQDGGSPYDDWQPVVSLGVGVGF